MHQSGLYVSCRRRPHHEAPKCSLVESHSTIGCVHIRNDLFWIQQNNKVLRQHTQGVDDKVFLRQPNGSTLCNAELRADHANVHVRELMWILDRFYTSCAVDLRHCGAHHFCAGMQCHQFGLGLRCTADIMESASSFAEMLFKCRLERTARPCEDRNVRVFHWFRKIGADRSQNCLPASLRPLHFRSDSRDTTRGRFAWQDVGVRDRAPKGSESCCTRGSAARIPKPARQTSAQRDIPQGEQRRIRPLRMTAVLPTAGIPFSPLLCAT